MAQTDSAALAAAIRFTVQKGVLANLRSELVYADPQFTEEGRFDSGSDMLTFITVPDLAVSTSTDKVQTEGSANTAKALTISTVTVSTDQYMATVNITDVAIQKQPIDLVRTATERVGRHAKVLLDTVARDTVALGGTIFYGAASHSTRATLDSGDKMTAALLTKLRQKMFKAGVPLRADGTYLFICSPEVGYDLRTDTSTGNFVTVNQYSKPETVLKNEIGMLSGFRIIENPSAPTFASSVTVQCSFALGAVKPWGAGSLESLKTFYVAPGGDHSDPAGQLAQVGYIVNWGVAPLATGYYYRVESYGTPV